MLFHEGKVQSVLTIMQSIKGAKTSVPSRRVNSISGKIFIAGNLSGSCPVWFGPEIMRMCKHWGKLAQDAELHHKCRVEDISSNSDYSPETDGGFQFLIATVQVKKNLFPRAIVVAEPPLMEGEQDGTFLSAEFWANRYSWESKQIPFHQLDREGDLDWLSM